jgi:asparagine synthase (glutamine-hydrolysing)
MLACLRSQKWHHADPWVDESSGIALGQAARDPIDVHRSGDITVVCDGEIYDVDANDPTEGSAEHASHAARLGTGFDRHGREFLRTVHGSFVAAIWDASRQELHLVTDRFGSRPLYYARLTDRLVFASSLKAVMADSAVSPSANWRGVAQFFTFGHYLLNDTSVADVEVLPAAAIATYRASSSEWSLDTYWGLADAAGTSDLAAGALLDRIDTAFGQAVERTTDTAPGLGLALSGGLDARTILACIDPHSTPLQTVCLGMKGSLDHRCSQQMAQVVGCPHHNHILASDFLQNFRSHLSGMTALTDGQYLSQCIIMPTLPLYRELGITTLLRGHAGELMHMHKAYAYSLDERAMQPTTDAQVAAWLHEHLQAYMLSEVEKPLFAARRRDEIADLARESFDEAFAATACDGPPLNRVWRMFIQQRLRRETSLSLVKFRSVVETRAPYLDADLIELLLAAPPSMKLGETIQTHILKKRRPELLNVTNANTGARVGAGRLSRKLATLRMRAFAKLGVPGYQPYERLGLWLRRELAPTVREILLDERCLDRGIYDADGIRAVVDAHLDARRNHTFLLMALMIFELGQQRLAKEEMSPLAALAQSKDD